MKKMSCAVPRASCVRWNNFPPGNVVMRLRCLVVIVFSWKHGPMYRCWLYATVAHVHEGFLRLLIGWSSQCLGGRSYWGGIFLLHFHQFAVCSWANCAGGVLWLSSSENVCPRRAMGQQCCAHPLTRQVHDCMIRAAQGFLPSLTGESIPVETVISKSLGCDESQMMFLKNLRLFSPRCFVHAISLLPCKSISYYFSFLFSFFGWANGRELWSQLNGLEEV